MYQCLTEYIDSKILRVKQEVQRTIRQEFQNLAQTLTPNRVMSTVGGEEANDNRATNRDGQLYELDVVKCEVERLRSLTIPLTFEIPKDMLVNEKEAMVAIYLYNANASPDEEILVYEGVDGCRRSFDALKPMRQIYANILTMVACTMTHEEKIRSGGPKIRFLSPRVFEQALSFVYPPTAVIYVPIKDNFKHWYLLCVDVKKRKLICANFIDWMIHEQLLDERIEGKSNLDEVAYQLGEFRIYYPQNLPQQENAFDSRMWVARWQLYAEARNSFIIPPVDDTARMRLALDLVLTNYNKAKENTIDAAKKLKPPKIKIYETQIILSRTNPPNQNPESPKPAKPKAPTKFCDPLLSLSCKLATSSTPPRFIAIHGGPLLQLLFRLMFVAPLFAARLHNLHVLFTYDSKSDIFQASWHMISLKELYYIIGDGAFELGCTFCPIAI
ncbi:hypothetical protein S83_059867, partial [Arachis hypogaea]